MSKSLSIIGAGRVGKVLGALFHQRECFSIKQVCNRTFHSTQSAVRYIGAGGVIGDIRAMMHADVWMIAVSDREIRTVAQILAEAQRVRKGDVVFHCSGALSSQELFPLIDLGARVASVHPMKSFADCGLATASFAGTWCALEGDEGACSVLQAGLSLLGARILPLTAEAKSLCHVGHVFASNYVVAVLEAAERLYRAAGVPAEVIRQFMPPLTNGTVENVTTLGPTMALTGPIARGDAEVVSKHCHLIKTTLPELLPLYTELGKVALEVAQAGGLSSDRISAVAETLRE